MPDEIDSHPAFILKLMNFKCEDIKNSLYSIGISSLLLFFVLVPQDPSWEQN
jgi:hypothetical protein